MTKRLRTYQTYLGYIFVILTLLITTITPGNVSAQSNYKVDAALLAAPPTINIWFGNTQTFGATGLPQRQINILGNVSDPDGIALLTYTLNGGSPKNLSLGPDTRRLLEAGDFNVELFDTELTHGANQVAITATDTLAETSIANVTVNYYRNNIWPLPYTTNWNSGIQSQSQVVDGKWEVQGGGLRTMQVGYDRLVAIGDIGWKDYEVTVPITINNVNLPSCSMPPSNCPGIGLIMRWTGNSDDPVAGEQPKEGWWPLGAIGWIRWQNTTSTKLQIFGNHDADIASTAWTVPANGETYYFKMRVETTGSGPQYRLKVWSSLVTEPVDWNLTGTGNPNDPASGSIVLIAHHVDATFGNVAVTRLGSLPVPSTIQSDDFRVSSLNTGLWTFVNPKGDGSYGITGANTADAWLNISVPAGSDHDLLVGDNRAPRVMQSVNDTDFDVEVKFESGLLPMYQMQGIIIQQDANNYARFEFFGDGAGTRIYAARYSNSGKELIANNSFGVGQIHPLYLRILRNGNRWIMFTSLDGSNWTPYLTVPFKLAVSSIGVYGANATGGSSPAFTGKIDYFFNRAAPIQPEDVIPVLDNRMNLPLILK